MSHGRFDNPVIATLTGILDIYRKQKLSERLSDADRFDGKTCIITGATGGVGHFGVQAVKAMGAHVTATCSAENADLARELGADEVYGYSGENTIRRGTRFDAILDAWGMMVSGRQGQ